MMISKTGAIIAASSDLRDKPFELVDSITVVEHIVIALQRSGVFPIVVITGKDVQEMRDKLYSKGVVFLRNTNADTSDLITSAKLGFEFLQNKVERIIFSPVNFPFFSEQTLDLLKNAQRHIAVPIYENRAGHPLSFSNCILSDLLVYKGEQGIRSFIDQNQKEVEYVAVNDKSILYKVGNGMQLEKYLNGDSCRTYARLDMKLEREHAFFNVQTKLLLFLISNSYSMKKASEKMAISNTKAWQLINQAEKSVKFKIVERKHGGDKGGATKLSMKGKQLLIAYQKLEEDVFSYTQKRFEDIFKDTLNSN